MAVNRPVPIATETSSSAVTLEYLLLMPAARTATDSFMTESSARPRDRHIRNRPR